MVNSLVWGEVSFTPSTSGCGSFRTSGLSLLHGFGLFTIGVDLHVLNIPMCIGYRKVIIGIKRIVHSPIVDFVSMFCFDISSFVSMGLF